MISLLYFCLLVLCLSLICFAKEDFCDIEDIKCSNPLQYRYLLYDINPPEGFNLRRDVYLRYAVLAKKLKDTRHLNDFKLVLPPWSNLYHWKNKEEPEQIPWSYFFDIQSLKLFAPVIEMHDFFNELNIRYPPIRIDEVYVLQHYNDMFETGNFEERMSVENCNKDIQTSFYYYTNMTSNNIQCLSFHGHTLQLTQVLEQSGARSIMFDHAEVALHDRFGDEIYWKARRSMRFNKELINIANDYRQKFLNSTDEQDDTLLPVDWRQEKLKRTAKGGPYLGVHLRRRDFVWSRRNEVPSLERAARQIIKLLKKLNLNSVFIATDAPLKEFEHLEGLIPLPYEVFKYKPNKSVKKKYKEGGVAIIDQILCSHAQYFIGTFESTFSFRIQEEREIMGFPTETTFNRFCGDKEDNCQRPSIWKIVH